MYLYCRTWNLEVNASKIKAVIFSKRKISDKSVFTLNGEMLNVVDDFAYLGIMFMSNGSFSKNRVKLLEQGRKAMFSMLRKSLGLPIDIQLQMFDTMISPILLYGVLRTMMPLSLCFYNFIKLFLVSRNLLLIVYYMES